MNIYDSLDKIRSKSVAVRRQIVFVLSLAITVLIFVVWGINVTLMGSSKLNESVTSESSISNISTTTQNETVGLNSVKENNYDLSVHFKRVKLGGLKIIDKIKELRQ